MNLEKANVLQGLIKILQTENGEINDPIKINEELRLFFLNFILKKTPCKIHEINEMLKEISLLLLNFQQKKIVIMILLKKKL